VRKHGIAVLAISFTLSFAACSAAGNEREASPATNGCQIDAARICRQMRHTFSSSSSALSQAQQNASATRDLVVPIRMPHGEPSIDIHCGINTRDQSVTYVRVAQAPNMTFNDEIFLRSRGYCSD
jgi:hypothetical protein